MKSIEKLKKYLQSVYPLSDETFLEWMDNYEYFWFPKQTVLGYENRLIHKCYFLESGYVRSFVYDRDGMDITIHIFSAPCFVTDFSALFGKFPSRHNYETITDCEGWSMSLENIEEWYHTFPEYRKLGTMLVLNQSYLQDERMLGMIKDNAETRYLKLLSDQPNIFQHIPLKIIASYLGITDTSLSRIRRELTQNKTRRRR